MTNYIPHHRKKKEILKKREKELTRTIINSSSLEQLSKAAENVREANIRVINAKVAQLKPDGEGNDLIEKARIDTETWLNKSVNEIIEDYTTKIR